MAIGQERLLATPLQMATVAATIANGGMRMAPSLVDKAISPSGKTVVQSSPEQISRVMSSQTAAELTAMMRRVVEEGTGTAANVGDLSVAGKTGTAETGLTGLNNAWFIAFAPADGPRIAVAVVIERTPEFGGTVAAPIARDVIRAYLASERGKVGRAVGFDHIIGELFDGRYRLERQIGSGGMARRVPGRGRDAAPAGRDQDAGRALHPGRRSSSSGSAARPRPPPG